MTPLIVETAHREGAFGAKGVGEPGLALASPVIGNTIFDAFGVRVNDLPITQEQTVRLLKEKENKNE